MALSAQMPDLKSLEVLLAIARTGGLGAAGRELGLSQQSVSARLSAMEGQTGVRLVVRTARGSRLSPAGVLVGEWAEQLVAAAERVDAGLATLRQESRVRVRVAASLTVAEQMMPRWIVAMQVEAGRNGVREPDIILTAMNSDRVLAAVHEHHADIGFIEGPTVPRDMQSRVIAQDDLVVVVPPEHKWAHRQAPITASELSRTPLVLREPGSGTRESLMVALRKRLGDNTVHAPPAIELNSSTAIRAAVLSGAGPAVISRRSIADDLFLHRLRVIPVTDLDLRRYIRAVWIGSATPPPGAVGELLAHVTRRAPVMHHGLTNHRTIGTPPSLRQSRSHR